MIRLAVASLALLTTPATGQVPAPPQAPAVIAAVGTGEVHLPPEYAVLHIAIEVQDAKATTAAERTRRNLAAVFDTLVALGVPRDSLATTSYGVQPDWDFEHNRSRGYQVSSMVRVTIHNLEQLGAVLDGVIAAGASRTSSIQYEVASPRNARDEALRLAVESARRDAEVMAAAAGGKLGSLLELRTGQLQSRAGLVRLEALTVTSSPTITPQDVVITVETAGMWEFLDDSSQ
jgi:uncharacterized protein YggE